MTQGRKPGFKHDQRTKQKISKSATTHGVYSLERKLADNSLDGRTRQAKALEQLEIQLMGQCPDEPTAPMLILAQRVARKTVLAAACEEALLLGKLDTLQFYVSLTNGLRLDLLALDRLVKEHSSSSPLSYEQYVQQLRSASDIRPVGLEEPGSASGDREQDIGAGGEDGES